MPDALAPRSPALLDAAGAAALVASYAAVCQGRGLEGHRPHRCPYGPLHRSFAALPGRHRRCLGQAGRHAARRSAGLVQGAGRAHDRAGRPAGQQPARYAEEPAGESRGRADLPDPRHHRDGARGGHGAAVGRSRAAGLDGGAGQGAQVRHRDLGAAGLPALRQGAAAFEAVAARLRPAQGHLPLDQPHGRRPDRAQRRGQEDGEARTERAYRDGLWAPIP